MNPAFTRMHPTKNVIYSCTESVEEDGEIVCWDVCPETGKLTLLSSADAFGTSTCYITIDKVGRLFQFGLKGVLVTHSASS